MGEQRAAPGRPPLLPRGFRAAWVWPSSKDGFSSERAPSIRLTTRGERRLAKAVEQLGDARRSLIDLWSQLKN